MSITGRTAVSTGALLAAGFAMPAAGGVQFVDVSGERGIGGYRMAVGYGGGVAAADFDDDGDIDLFVPNGQGVADQLYRNLGNGVFEDVAGLAGLGSTGNTRAALWFDSDGDHLLDLIVARDRWHLDTHCETLQPSQYPQTLILYRNYGDLQFADVTVLSGLGGNLVCCGQTHTGGLAAGDINGDGYLDLCYTQWYGYTRLYLNDGDGTFTNITSSSGISPAFGSDWQPVMFDFNDDGWTDIFVAVDFDPNRLWINQHDNTFVDQAPVMGLDNAMNDMGVALGDYDNDGDLDVYITNIVDEPGETQPEHNVLLRNFAIGGSHLYVDVSETVGVDHGYWGWGTTFIDADNDGWLDLAATNGFCWTGFVDDPSRFFTNLGGDPPSFANDANLVGFDDTNWGSCLVAFDTDRDGGLDLVQACNLGGPLRVLENQRSGAAAANHYLVVQPRISGPNHRAIGSLVRVTAGGTTRIRPILAGTSFLGQEPAEAFFGLGAATTAETVEVTWPDGTTRTVTDVAVDRVIVVAKCPGDFDYDGQVGFGDLLSLLGAWGPCTSRCLHDFDGDGAVGFSDLLALLGTWGQCG